jgi:hypothetical protein
MERGIGAQITPIDEKSQSIYRLSKGYRRLPAHVRTEICPILMTLMNLESAQ